MGAIIRKVLIAKALPHSEDMNCPAIFVLLLGL
jgi:hypothetical protein